MIQICMLLRLCSCQNHQVGRDRSFEKCTNIYCYVIHAVECGESTMHKSIGRYFCLWNYRKKKDNNFNVTSVFHFQCFNNIIMCTNKYWVNGFVRENKRVCGECTIRLDGLVQLTRWIINELIIWLTFDFLAHCCCASLPELENDSIHLLKFLCFFLPSKKNMFSKRITLNTFRIRIIIFSETLKLGRLNAENCLINIER